MEKHELKDLKRCTKCGDWKPRTSEFFSIDRRSRITLISQCKVCVNAHYKEYRERNKEHIRAWRRTPERRAKQIEHSKKYAQANSESVRAKQAIQRRKVRDRINKYRRDRRASKKFFDLMTLTGEINGNN